MDFLSFSAMLGAFTVMDYMNDRELLKRERLHEYRECFENLGDDVTEMSCGVLTVLQDSGRYDIGDIIIRGSKQFPLRIFRDVLKVQDRKISRHQESMIDMYFEAIDDIGYDKDAFYRAVYRDERPENDVCMSADGISVYARALSDLTVTEDPGEEMMDSIYGRIGRIAARFGYLGGCPSDRTEIVYDNLRSELSLAMSSFITESMSSYDDESLVKNAYEDLKDVCRDIRMQGDEDDELITDLFDHFVISLCTGILMESACTMEDKAELLDALMKELEIEMPMEAEAIVCNIDSIYEVRNVFYNMANEWGSPNYWSVLFTACARHGLDDESYAFLERAIGFVQQAGGFFVSLIPGAVEGYEVDGYLSGLAEDLKAFMAGIEE